MIGLCRDKTYDAMMNYYNLDDNVDDNVDDKQKLFPDHYLMVQYLI